MDIIPSIPQEENNHLDIFENAADQQYTSTIKTFYFEVT